LVVESEGKGEKRVKSNKFGYYQNKYQIIDKFNDSDQEIKQTGYLLAIVLAIIALGMYFAFVSEKIKTLITGGSFSHYSLLFVIPSLVIVMILHELIHSLFLWFFSKQKPIVRINYSLLKSNASVSKKEGVISYLAPFVVISLALVLTSIFTSPAIQLALIIIALIHGPTCHFDFLFAFRLYKCRGANIRLAHEKCKKGIDTIFFRG
jgi:hypothetical protein